MLILAMLVAAPTAAEQTFEITLRSPDLVGELSLTTTVHGDTLSDMARAYDQGYREMRLANPNVDPWLPGEGAEIMVPNLYVLPDAPRKGLVINVVEMRLYLFLQGKRDDGVKIMTFPVSIGRQDWVTPQGATKIVSKVKDPSWYPPESIREEHALAGDPLPRIVAAGPDNPLGAHALRLSLPGYLIHGTNKPYGIGMRVTHGCVRMYPKDVSTVFGLTRVGTEVYIVNQPYKVGISHDKIYLEVHPHLDEDKALFAEQYSLVMRLILDRVGDRDVQLMWSAIRHAVEVKDGIPRPIGSVKIIPDDARGLASTSR